MIGIEWSRELVARCGTSLRLLLFHINFNKEILKWNFMLKFSLNMSSTVSQKHVSKVEWVFKMINSFDQFYKLIQFCSYSYKKVKIALKYQNPLCSFVVTNMEGE